MKSRCICLVCGVKKISPVDSRIESNVDAAEIFRTFSKHMEWEEVGEEKEFQFGQEAFPFCEDCQSDLIYIHKLDEEAQHILTELNHAVANVSARLVGSVQNGSGPEEGSEGEGSNDKYLDESDYPYNAEKVQFYRQMTFSRFCPTVKLQDFQDPLSTEIKEAVPPPQNSGENVVVSNPGSIYACKIKLEPEEIYLNSGALAVSPIKLLAKNEDEGEEPCGSASILPFIHQPSHGVAKPGLPFAMKRTSVIRPGTTKPVPKLKPLHEGMVFKHIEVVSQPPSVLAKYGYGVQNRNSEILRSLICSSCNRKFSSRLTLRNHTLSGCKGYGRAKKIPSEFVRQINDTEYVYRGFKFEQLKDGRFKCGVCNSLYFTKNNTSSHILKKHARKLPGLTVPKKPTNGPSSMMITPISHGNLEAASAGSPLSSANVVQQLLRIQPKAYSGRLKQAGEIEYRGFRFKNVNGIFKCCHCNYSSPIRRYARRHITRAHFAKGHADRRYRRERHRLTQISEGVYSYKGVTIEKLQNQYLKCSQCDFTSANSNSITIHILRNHCSSNSSSVNPDSQTSIQLQQSQENSFLIPGRSLSNQSSVPGSSTSLGYDTTSSDTDLLNSISFLVPNAAINNSFDQEEQDARSDCSETILGHLTSDEEEQELDGLLNNHVMVYDQNSLVPGSEWQE